MFPPSYSLLPTTTLHSALPARIPNSPRRVARAGSMGTPRAGSSVLVSEDVEKTSSSTYDSSRAVAVRRVYRANEVNEVIKEFLLAVLHRCTATTASTKRDRTHLAAGKQQTQGEYHGAVGDREPWASNARTRKPQATIQRDCTPYRRSGKCGHRRSGRRPRTRKHPAGPHSSKPCAAAAASPASIAPPSTTSSPPSPSSAETSRSFTPTHWEHPPARIAPSKEIATREMEAVTTRGGLCVSTDDSAYEGGVGSAALFSLQEWVECAEDADDLTVFAELFFEEILTPCLGEEGVEARDDAVKEEMEENADEDMVPGRLVPQFLRAVMAHCQRWEDFDVLMPFEHMHLLHGDMPLLRTLAFSPSNFPHGRRSRFAQTPFHAAPQLKRVILTRNFFTSVTALPWAQLTHLEADCLYEHECLEILRDAPLLISRTFRLCHPPGAEPILPPNPWPSALPAHTCLRDLVLDADGEFLGVGATILSWLSAVLNRLMLPALCTLLVAKPCIALELLAAFIARSGCYVKNLCIAGASLP
ncbi:hypothetical protein B0H14DRAFT_3853060 [Mycena olivaceomarginata]|nr:hypothetical protein B0H14DRAFT_3853060 [Mycena olivaceomarginata]